jgi:predicted O-linked N-acetylglucosamine transferase (SPINDLY family)
VPPERIELRGTTSRPDHLAALNGVDICLDTFPQNGGVSTWEALQMGVPVVALIGATASSRVAAAILTAVGMTDWIADSPESYVATVVTQGSKLDELSRLRRALPGRVAASVAGNPRAYAEQVSKAYRNMWQAYCSTSAA